MVSRACTVCGRITADGKARCSLHPNRRSPSSAATSKYQHKKARKALHGQRCHLCGGTIEPHELHADHVLPVSKGGEHGEIRAAHARCNLQKGNRTDANLPRL